MFVCVGDVMVMCVYFVAELKAHKTKVSFIFGFLKSFSLFSKSISISLRNFVVCFPLNADLVKLSHIFK